ncbi:helix-turn-helix domain-containing protein [Streptomyces sp. TRM66268-LWL]|uniref:Helix-turn-helix domain-containing protein n=1 Tax=Streptomyces polyasparticus TaxID=2767826 RepID=A0ABR7SEF5_9ACTN|nr:helix-turn-helix domain-containing protein [Streptomyces polyasparticus]MBC9712826.1 helix-turn-helix domain-containing protein [Streptomyces polyasparticus]
MEALAVHLSRLDARAEEVVRVVLFYDTLMRRRVDLPALARASAGLAQCVAGIRLGGTGRTFRMAADGRAATTPPSAPSSALPVVLDEEEIGTVWLERPGSPALLDPVLLERLALAVAAVVERYGPARTTMADPALVELVISADSDDAARARALRLLGFPAGRPVRAVAVRTRLPLDRVGALICPAGQVKAAPLADAGVLLATGVDTSGLPSDVRAGVGAAVGPELSWRQARSALRFTTADRPVVEYAALGALALLAETPRDALLANADVTAVAALAADPEDLATLDAYLDTASLRRAAEVLHLHHSSVARRIEQIGKSLGIGLAEPGGLVRARLAVTAWRLTTEG